MNKLLSFKGGNNYLIIILLVAILAIACDRKSDHFYQMEPNSIVIVPDIQIYTMNSFSSELSSIIGFINANRYNISLCLQTGDLTNNNTAEQWDIALNEYINKLNPDIIHFECLGNHDYGDNGTTNSRVSNIPWDISNNAQISFGDYCENYLDFVQISGKEYGVLVLEFAVRDTTLEWANKILNKYQNTPFILLTHAFLNKEGDLYNNASNPNELGNPYSYELPEDDINDSSELYDKLLSRHNNIKVVFSGHSLPKEGFKVKTLYSKDNSCIRVITINYQHFVNGGNSNIAIARFDDEVLYLYICYTKDNTIKLIGKY